MKFEGNDRIEEAITNASNVLADEAFKQNGQSDMVVDHNDTWYAFQEKLREAMLNAAFKVIDEEDSGLEAS